MSSEVCLLVVLSIVLVGILMWKLLRPRDARRKIVCPETKYPPVPMLKPGSDTQKLVFTGHQDSDCDSIFASIGAAALYGGIAARSNNDAVKKDITLALQRASLPLPIRVDAVAVAGADIAWGLVDHEAASLNPLGVDVTKIVYVVDHHLLEGVMPGMNKIIYVDIKPWGSTCTILTWQYIFYGVPISKEVATGLMCGIISDTINLFVNTTEYDRMALDVLRGAAGMSLADFNGLAKDLIAAGSDYSGMTPTDIINNDYKTYTVKPDPDDASKDINLGISSIKTVDLSMFGVGNAANLATYIGTMDSIRTKTGLNIMLAGIILVSSTEAPSPIILLYGSDQASKDLANNPAMGGTKINDNMLQTAFLSRKTDLVPAILKILNPARFVPKLPVKAMRRR